MVKKERNIDEMVMQWEGWLAQLAKVCKKDIFTKMPKQNVFFFNAKGDKLTPKRQRKLICLLGSTTWPLMNLLHP